MAFFLLTVLYLVAAFAVSIAGAAVLGLALWAGMECLDAVF